MTPQPELTVKSVGLGLFLALVFGAANAYLGMKAGQTVAATIPAAVIAMALFRLKGFKGGILEQNITRTAASVGEALVAGAIFTIPAFLFVDLDGKRLWTDLRSHYWESSLVLLVGGLIGVFFIILLRKPLCVDSDLPFPEAVASVEIVRASEGSADAPRTIFGAMAFGGLIQMLKSPRVFVVFKEYLEGFWPFPPSTLSGLGTVTRGGGIAWTTPALSPALIGVGYIIGPELASINFAGGLMAWWLFIPTLQLFDPDLASRIGGNADPQAAAALLWKGVVRPIAIGAMLVSSASTMWSMRESLMASVKGAFEAGAAKTSSGDIPTKWVFGSIAALLVPTAFIYHSFTGNWPLAIGAAAIMAVTGFVLSAIGGYLVGLVGSSNQPLSGLTLSALLISALLLVSFGVTGAAGIAAVLGVAAVVCVAGSVSGSLIQDLKAGHLLGGTPWKMQVVEIVAVAILAFFLMGPIIALHESEAATGGIGGRNLPAPQAALMAQLAKGIVGGQMAWGLLFAGVAFGIALLLCRARAPMLIAVGMYLPFETSAAIFVGGLCKWMADRISRDPKVEEKGTLVASGLIAGEAIVGILLAVAALQLPERPGIAWFEAWGGWLSLAGFAAIGWALVKIPTTSYTKAVSKSP